MNDQESVTRSFIADHLKSAHRTHPSDAFGCMICSAWRWAREIRSMDDGMVRSMLEAMPAIISIASVPRITNDDT